MLSGFGTSFNWRADSFGTTVSSGDTITPGFSNVEGSWAELWSAAQVAEDVYGILLWVSNNSTSASARNVLLDIGVDPAGGTAYASVMSNLVIGQSGGSVSGGVWWYFPLRVRAGSSIGVRAQSSLTTGGFNCRGTLYGKPTRPEAVRAGSYSETIGTITNSNGTSFTPGNSSAKGAWASLGTTGKDLWWWQLGVQIDNGTTTSLLYFIDLAYGDGTNMVPIFSDVLYTLPGTTEVGYCVQAPRSIVEAYREVPAGSTIYIRGACSGTAPAGFNAVAVGVGG